MKIVLNSILLIAFCSVPFTLKSQWKVKKDGNPFDGEILSAYTVGEQNGSSRAEPILVVNTYVKKGGINFYLSGLTDKVSEEAQVSFAINGKIYNVNRPEVSDDGYTIFFKEFADPDLMFGVMEEQVYFNLLKDSKRIDIRIIEENGKVDFSFNGDNFDKAIQALFPERDFEQLYSDFIESATKNDSIGRIKAKKIARLLFLAEDSLGIVPEDMDHIEAILTIQAGLDERAFFPENKFETGGLTFKYNCKYSTWTEEKTVSLFYELNGELEEISDNRNVTEQSIVYTQFYENREKIWRMLDPINTNPLDGLESKLSIPFITWDLNKNETTFKYNVLDITERLIYSSDSNLNPSDIAKIEIKLSDSMKWQVSSFELVVTTRNGETLKDIYSSISNNLIRANLKSLNVRGGDVIQLNF